MKVGTDGVLLGAWSTLPTDTPLRILDIGTGTGLIALMLAQRYPLSTIDAIEIDPDAARQAADNATTSPFARRVNIIHADLRHFTPDTRYDAIVSNPPYFASSLPCPDPARTAARHDTTLTLSDLVSHTARLIRPGGTLSVILPYAEKDHFIGILRQYHLHPSHLTTILPTPTSAPKRLLISSIFAHSTDITAPSVPLSAPITDTLTIELSRHTYTPAYIALTRDFYLKM